MTPEAAKLIGAGLASIALVGAGVGIGTICKVPCAIRRRRRASLPTFCWALPLLKPPACSAWWWR
jgi:hypothetical protein